MKGQTEQKTDRATASRAHVGPRGFKALYVGPCSDEAGWLQETLSASGLNSISLTHAPSLSQARMLLAHDAFHIFLLPADDGVSTSAPAIQELHEAYPAIPIVLLADAEDERNAMDAIQHGVDDFIVRSRVSGEIVSRMILHSVERHRALHEEEQKIRSIIEANVDGMLIVSEKNKVRFGNSAAGRILGLEVPHLVGSSLEFEVPDGGTKEIDIPVAGDAPLTVEVSSNQLLWKEEPCRLVILRDVSERRQLASRMEEAQRMESLGRLAGGIAHDFNNIMTAVMGYSRMVLDQLEPHSPVWDDASEVVSHGERAARLTKKLLAFCRQEPQRLVALNLSDLLDEMARMLRSTLGEHIEMVTLLDPSQLPILADPTQVEQVLMNLVLNARDAMLLDGGTLTIKTYAVVVDEKTASERPGLKAGHFVVLHVEDTGHGMDEQTRSRAIEPFFTTKELDKGTGLGLASTYGIIAETGGYLDIASQVGRGTTVRAFWPVAKKEADLIKAIPKSKPPQGAETILVVEDEDSIRNLVCKTLGGLGYKILEARHGSAALDVANDFSGGIDLVLTDVVMPHMDGPELVQQLTGRREGFRVLYMSGYARDRLAEESLNGVRCELLPKPYTPDQLARKVREVLDANGA